MLYIVMLGGRHPRASIEVHDVVFAQAQTLEQTYPQLRQGWFGSREGLHIDGWLEVDGIDAYRVEFSHLAPGPDDPRLFSLTSAAMSQRSSVKRTATFWSSLGTSNRQDNWASSACTPTGSSLTPTQYSRWMTACRSTVWMAVTCTVEGAHSGIGQYSDYLLL